MKIKICFYLVLVFISRLAFAQPDEEFRKLKELYPNNEVVMVSLVKTIDISMKNDDFVIKYDQYEERIYLNDNAKHYDKSSIFMSDIFDLKKYEAYTLSPEPKKYKKYKVDRFTLSDLSQGNIFYDDSKELNYSFPLLTKGAKTVEILKYELKEPYFLPIFSVSPYMPYQNVEFKITVDDKIELEILELLFSEQEGLILNEEKKSGRTTKTYTFSRSKPVKYERNAPSHLYMSPKILMRIKTFQTKNGSKNLLSTLDDLHEWYCKTISPSMVESDEITMLADTITHGMSDTLEMASAIFNWVQKNIKYIAIEDGERGIVPEKAKEVYFHRYGDCKGMSNLAYHLMRSKGIDARLAWVGTRSLPFKYTEVPTPNVDNHMICALVYKNEVILLDGTHSFLPFGMPSPFIQGKEVLVNGKDCKSYQIEVAKIVPANLNQTLDSCFVQISGRDLVGRGKAIYTGFSAMEVRELLTDRNSKDRLKIFREVLLRGNNKFTLDSFQLEKLDNINEPLVLNYYFKIPDYVIINKNESYINLNLDRTDLPGKFPKTREVAYEKRFSDSESNVVVLELLENQKVTTLPTAASFKKGNLKFENSYSNLNNSIYRKHYFEHDALILETKDFEEWNQAVEEIIKNYNQQLVIITQ